jgi:hypothetical protein
MSCRRCGLQVKKNDRFILVGFYPVWWKRMNYPASRGLDYFGELYHEACYLESVERQKSKQKEDAKP